MQPEIHPDENRHRPEADRHAHEDRRWAPAHKRLYGFAHHLLRRNPGSIWVQLKPSTFCELTGLCDRTFWRALRQLREMGEDETGLRIRTVNTPRKGSGKKNWMVLVAVESQLLLDGQPHFFDCDDRPRYVRPSLREPCLEAPERPPETETTPVSEGNHPPTPTPVLKRTTEPPSGIRTNRSDIPIREVSPIQPQTNPPRGGSGSIRPRGRPRWKPKPITKEGLGKLRRCAYAITDRHLSGSETHWDNCRIDFDRDKVAGWVLGRLRVGHWEERIVKAYRIALKRAHGFSVDLEAGHGEFTLASTFSFASKLLARDHQSASDRVGAFYQEVEELEAAILASWDEDTEGNSTSTEPDPTGRVGRESGQVGKLPS